MDKFGDMAAFVRVVEARTFTQAAERLGWSKSVVSRRIAELEERLGVRLLNRSTRRLSLTEAGQAYYERCARILADVDETEEAVSSLHAAPRGLLRVNAPMTFGMLHLAPAISAFMDRYPEMEIDLVLNDRFVDLIDEGFDLALRIGNLADSALIARKLAPCLRVACASPGYLARRGVPADPAALAGHDTLLYSNIANADQWRLTDREGFEHAVRVKSRLRVNNGDVLREAAAAGLGITLLPTFIVAEAIAEGRLKAILCDYRPLPTAVHAVYPHNRHLSTKVRAFVDFLAERFGPPPYWDEPLKPVLGTDRQGAWPGA
jgi:DNA-binding transcriptional LysR family regulator